jgi:TolB protein
VRLDGTPVRTIYYQASEDDDGLNALLPGLGLSVSYNSGLAWSPRGERFVFMSNAGEGNYDLYLGNLQGKTSQRLTDSPQKDGQPDWSPTDNTVAFVSGRDGGAHLYLLDVDSRRVASASMGDKAYLYPRWSPDGKRIAVVYGDNENHDIAVLDDIVSPAELAAAAAAKAAAAKAAAGTPAKTKPGAAPAAPPPPAKPPAVQRALTAWAHDDLSPTWSPDGRRVAFYTNYNPEGDPKVWAIVVVESERRAPAGEAELIARVVARNVVPDVAVGPAWLPDGRRIAYVGNDKNDYNPIYIVDVESKQSVRLKTDTHINRELSVSPQGLIAFRAQVEQWDRVFIARLSDQGTPD